MTGRHPARNLIWKAHRDSRCVSASKDEGPVCHAPAALINSLQGMMSSCGNKPGGAKTALAKRALLPLPQLQPLPLPFPWQVDRSWCNCTEAKKTKNKLLNHKKEKQKRTSFKVCSQKALDVLSLKIAFHFNDKKKKRTSYFLLKIVFAGWQNELRQELKDLSFVRLHLNLQTKGSIEPQWHPGQRTRYRNHNKSPNPQMRTQQTRGKQMRKKTYRTDHILGDEARTLIIKENQWQ